MFLGFFGKSAKKNPDPIHDCMTFRELLSSSV